MYILHRPFKHQLHAANENLGIQLYRCVSEWRSSMAFTAPGAHASEPKITPFESLGATSHWWFQCRQGGVKHVAQLAGCSLERPQSRGIFDACHAPYPNNLCAPGVCTQSYHDNMGLGKLSRKQHQHGTQPLEGPTILVQHATNQADRPVGRPIS